MFGAVMKKAGALLLRRSRPYTQIPMKLQTTWKLPLWIVVLLFILHIPVLAAAASVEDMCRAVPSSSPPRFDRDSVESMWYSPDGDFMGSSFCAGWRTAAEAAMRDNTLCKDAIRIDKPKQWREGFLHFYRYSAPTSGLQINNDNECLDGIFDPPAGLIQQCTTSLFGCNVRNPYSGFMLWPRVDLGGVYLARTGPIQRFDPGLSGGFTFAYWCSPKRFSSITFRLVTVGISLATGSVKITDATTNKEQTFGVLRYGALISFIQSSVVLEGGGYYVTASDMDIGKSSRNAFFLRLALNLADLPNLVISNSAFETARLLKQKPSRREPEESGDIR